MGNTHSAMGGYTRGRRWRVEERHRFITAQLYPTSDEAGTSYREQFQQVCLFADLPCKGSTKFPLYNMAVF